MQSDWFILVILLSAANQSALFQHNWAKILCKNWLLEPCFRVA